MSIQINFKNYGSNKSPANLVLFVDEKFNISGLKKYISNSEFSYISDLIKTFKVKVLETEDILKIFKCKTRNAQFQKKLIQYIDEIIDQEYDKSNPLNKRIFDKKMIQNN